MEQQKKAPTSNNTAEESHLPSSRGLSVVQRENFADDSVMTVSNTNARIEISPTSSNRASWRGSVMTRLRRSSYLSFTFGPGSLTTDGQKEEEGLEDKSCSKTVMHKLVFIQYPHLTLTMAVTILGWTTFLVLGSLGWPGETSKYNCFENYLLTPNCFCEHPWPGKIIAQPANTISNFTYNLAAIFLAWCADTHIYPNAKWWESHVNMLTEEKWFSLSFSVVLANVGFSSGMMHGGWNRWGDKLDSVSIIVLTVWIELFSFCKFFLMFVGWSPEKLRSTTKWHAGLFLVLGGALYIYDFARENDWTRVNVLFETTIGTSLLLEISIRVTYAFCKGNARYSRSSLGILGLLVLGVSYFIQNITKGGSKYCWPDSWFQGHAVWHFLSGLGIIPIYFFFLSEKFTMKSREGGELAKNLTVKDLNEMQKMMAMEMEMEV